MFYQIFLSPQVKRSTIISYKQGKYELPHELLNDLRLKSLPTKQNQHQKYHILRWSPQLKISHHYRTKTRTNTLPNPFWKMENSRTIPLDRPPAAIRKQPIQTNFKRPRENTSDSEEPSFTLTTLTKEQPNTAIHVCRELHKYSFRDVDKLQNINTDKKRRIILKAMYIKLGDYDPSNEYVANY